MGLFKLKKNTAIFLASILFLGTPVKACLWAQAGDSCPDLKKQILSAKQCPDYPYFEALKDCYFKDNNYNAFVEFLKSLKKKDCACFINYYIAQGRYRQLKYLEEAQSWDEYFTKGNDYRDEIVDGCQKAIGCAGTKSPLAVYARLVLWQFHKDQQDVFAENATADLIQSVYVYAKEVKDPDPIKKVADTLLAYQEKSRSRELYRLYMDKFVSAASSDEQLLTTAGGFLKDGNLDLAEAVYDIYADKISKDSGLPKDKLIASLIELAKQFAYKDQGQKDPAYAEKIFQKIEEIGGKAAFDQELIYLRGFNLEKMKEYIKARDVYLDLMQFYPGNSHADEINFKLGIIYAYVLRDIQKAQSYFEGLAQGQTANPAVLSSLYQLGLINQWQNDLAKAKDYYNRIFERAGNEFPQITALAGVRLQEIDQNKPIEDNLKNFLGSSFKNDYPLFNPTRVELKSSAYRPSYGQEVGISSAVYAEAAGCLQPQLTYLWSGDLGDASPKSDEANFSTKYTQPGSKIINLLVVSSTGIVDRSLDILDIVDAH